MAKKAVEGRRTGAWPRRSNCLTLVGVMSGHVIVGVHRRAAREWQRNHSRDAAQERGRGGQINEAGGISEAHMLAAAAVGRRHAAVGSAMAKTLSAVREDKQARDIECSTRYTMNVGEACT